MSASWAMRNSANCTAAAGGAVSALSRVTVMYSAENDATRLGSRARSGSGSGTSGAPGAVAPSARSTPSTDLTSSRAVLLASLMLASAAAALSGCFSARWRPTPACTLIWLSECESTSCSSRAIRTRSACTSERRRSASSMPSVATQATPTDTQAQMRAPRTIARTIAKARAT